MREFMTIAKALSDESRARVLMFLAEGELCVCQIVEMLHLAPSTVSKHMAVLYQARLVESRKDGRWIYYRLAGRGAPPEVRGAIRWVRQCLGDDRQARADARRLKAVRRMDLDNLCSRYRA
ncbi:MAG: metalloregulator ArsR/SmtB family transcription factor [Phycisphaerae bacterium]|jgi:DNA-binding transcriptional ArsR family regulator|nr:metalloregulator ArsR/SmtB family transcription factor [Phycisphaerae bacterium]